jgi:hypothetical protein
MDFRRCGFCVTDQMNGGGARPHKGDVPRCDLLEYGADMKLQIVAASLLVASCAVPPPGADEQQQQVPVELAGRAAGPPVNCVQTNQLDSLRISQNNRHALIYGSGRTVYANNLGVCRYGSDDVLVTEQFGSQLCRGDIVRSFDRYSRIPGPTCVLSDFVPYTSR